MVSNSTSDFLVKQAKYFQCLISIDLHLLAVCVTATDAHPVPGGVFPPPPAAADLIAKLPPPTSFNVSYS